MRKHTPCISLDLYSPLNRSGSRSWALLLNLFWRSDITQCPTSATQTHSLSTFCVEREHKRVSDSCPGLETAASLLPGKRIYRQIILRCSQTTAFLWTCFKTHHGAKNRKMCAHMRGFLSVLWLSPWGLQSHIRVARHCLAVAKDVGIS